MTMLSSNFNNTADTKKPGWYRISFLIIFSKFLIYDRLSSRFPIKIISSRFFINGRKDSQPFITVVFRALTKKSRRKNQFEKHSIRTKSITLQSPKCPTQKCGEWNTIFIILLKKTLKWCLPERSKMTS